jgi:hypothetical protein
VVVVITLIGLLYYLLTGRRKRFAPVITPEADDAPLIQGAATQE